MNSCIYKLLNTKTGAFYIGSTKNFPSRRREHLNDLRKNKHHSVYMQRSFNKHGEINFSFEILEECTVDILKVREQFYLDTLKPKYNMAKDALRPSLGLPVSFEIRKKISQAHKGNAYCLGFKQSEENKLKRKLRLQKTEINEKFSKSSLGKSLNTVLQLSREGKLIKEFASITEASAKTGIPRQTISQVCRGEYKLGYGFQWKYKETPKKHFGKKIIDLRTNIIYNSISECSKALDIHRNSIGNSLSGLNNSYKYLQLYQE